MNVIAAGRGLEADAMHQESEASRAGVERGRNRPTRYTGIKQFLQLTLGDIS